MKHLHLTLGYLREQRARLDTSIALLEALTGSNGHTNGSGALKVAADALALHEAHAVQTATAKRGRRAHATMRPLPEVTVPHGLDVRGLPLTEAIPAVLRAYKKPADTKHLAALLLGAGFEYAKTGPLTTTVGVWCGTHGRAHGIKGDTAGWRLR